MALLVTLNSARGGMTGNRFQSEFNNVLTAADGETPGPVVSVPSGFTKNSSCEPKGTGRHLFVCHMPNLSPGSISGLRSQ